MTSPDPLANRRRRLLFRATHRGTRENDLLVGGYVVARIEAMTGDGLDALEAVLDLPDPELAEWLTGRAPIPPGAPALVAAIRADALARAAR